MAWPIALGAKILRRFHDADTEQLLPDNVVEALVGEAFSSLDPVSQQVMQALAVLGAAVGFAITLVATKALTKTDSAITILLYMSLLQLPIGAIMARESGRACGRGSGRPRAPGPPAAGPAGVRRPARAPGSCRPC